MDPKKSKDSTLKYFNVEDWILRGRKKSDIPVSGEYLLTANNYSGDIPSIILGLSWGEMSNLKYRGRGLPKLPAGDNKLRVQIQEYSDVDNDKYIDRRLIHSKNLRYNDVDDHSILPYQLLPMIIYPATITSEGKKIGIMEYIWVHNDPIYYVKQIFSSLGLSKLKVSLYEAMNILNLIIFRFYQKGGFIYHPKIVEYISSLDRESLIN